MTKIQVQNQGAYAQQSLSLQQGSLSGYDVKSSVFIDLASQYCRMFNNESTEIFKSGEKLFGTLRLQMSVMPNMDVTFFAFNDPANTKCGKTIHSAATTLKHGDLALQIKDLCGKEPADLVTELMISARESGIKYLIIDLPHNQLKSAVSKLSLNESDANLISPLILKIQGAHPQLVSREEFLKEPGARELDISHSVIHQAMRKINSSVTQMNQLMDNLEAIYARRSTKSE